MNIGFIVPNINNTGGTERATINTCKALKKYTSYVPFIISVYGNNKIESIEDIEIYNLNLNNGSFLYKLLSYILFPLRLNKIVKLNQIKTIVGTTHVFNCLMYFSTKCKKIAWEHTIYEACPNYSNIIRSVIYPKLDSLILLSEKERIKYNYVPLTKRVSIPNISSFKCEKKALLKSKIIIAVGRLCWVKGYDRLLDIAAVLKERIPDWTIYIYGDGELKEQIVDNIHKNKLEEYVILKGKTNNIKEAIFSSSIMVMTSYYEGLPMALIEAQTCGVPIVSYDCPEGPATIVTDGVDGYLINDGNLNDFVDKVESLAINYEKRVEFGTNAFSSAQKYYDSSVCKKWKDLLDKICS